MAQSNAIIQAYNRHNGSLKNFYDEIAAKKWPEKGRIEIERILLRLPNFYLYQSPTKVAHMDTVRVYRPGSLSLDIAFVGKTIIFVAVDQFSRFIFAKKGVSKNTAASLQFFEYINKEMQNRDYLITAYSSDLEKSFLSSKVQEYARQRAQAYFLQTQNVHNSTCENAIKHLKRYIAKNRIVVESTTISHKVVELAVDNLNTMRRKVLGGFSAAEVMEKKPGSWRKVQKIMHANYIKKRAHAASKVLKKGTRVRIRPYASVYGYKADRGYWTDDAQFYVHRVLKGRAQIAYKLKQKVGANKFDHISSIFYPNELIAVHVPRS